MSSFVTLHGLSLDKQQHFYEVMCDRGGRERGVDSAVVDVVAGVVEVAKTITKLVKSMVAIMMFIDVLLQ